MARKNANARPKKRKSTDADAKVFFLAQFEAGLRAGRGGTRGRLADLREQFAARPLDVTTLDLGGVA